MADREATDPWVNPAFEQSVRDTAYFLWENDGQPEGREQEYWFRALEKCLRQYQSEKLLGQAPRNHLVGRQVDDNIDDLGRKVNDIDPAPMDQPASDPKT